MTLKLAEVWGFFAWVFAVCMLAGVVRVYRRFERERLSMFEIFGELFVSGFIGVMTFLLCVAFGVITLPPADVARASLVSFICGIAAHSSTRMLALYDHAVAKRVGNILGDGGDKKATNSTETEQGDKSNEPDKPQ
jgi:LydA holin phage, holin superfamily III